MGITHAAGSFTEVFVLREKPKATDTASTSIATFLSILTVSRGTVKAEILKNYMFKT